MALNGFQLAPGRLDAAAQEALLAEVFESARAAPFYQPTMPRTGTPLSVRMTNLGPLGWVSDVSGYRYGPRHPQTGAPWPPIPQHLLDLYAEFAPGFPPPEACLVNLYQGSARLGLHRDADEGFLAPVLSVSLGDTALYRIGGLSRKDPTRSVRLASGDVVVLGGEARLAYHGVDRILPGTSTLLRRYGVAEGGRINLTLRRVTPPVSG